jgi:acetyltransferase
LPAGNRVAIVTNSGGPAALASDSFAQYDITLAALSPETRQDLAQALNPAAQVANPVDMLGGASEGEYGHALTSVLQDDGVDMALVVLVPTSLVDSLRIAQSIIDAASGSKKPVAVCLMGFEAVQEAVRLLHANKIPTVDFPAKSGVLFHALLHQRRNQLVASKEKTETENLLSSSGAQEIFAQYPDLKIWGEHRTREILRAYHIPLVEGDLATDKGQAHLIAQKIGFPLVLKGASPDVLHKSEAQAVVVGIKDDQELDAAYDAVTKNMLATHPRAAIDGMLIEKMALAGKEVIVGVKRDPSFGPLVMFGMGGIFVELFKDVAFRVAPLSQADIQNMIRSTSAFQLLNGWRGDVVYDISALEDVIAKISQLAVENPQIREVEINPLRVYPAGEGVLALDCRMLLD